MTVAFYFMKKAVVVPEISAFKVMENFGLLPFCFSTVIMHDTWSDQMEQEPRLMPIRFAWSGQREQEPRITPLRFAHC